MVPYSCLVSEWVTFRRKIVINLHIFVISMPDDFVHVYMCMGSRASQQLCLPWCLSLCFFPWDLGFTCGLGWPASRLWDPWLLPKCWIQACIATLAFLWVLERILGSSCSCGDQVEAPEMELFGEKFSLLLENFVKLGYFVSWISDFLSWNSFVLNMWVEAV